MASTEAVAKAEDKRNRKGNLVRRDGRATFEEEAPLDRSFISGYGARPMANPHHRFWAHSLDPRLQPPPPGLVSGGPNSVSLRADAVGAALAGHCAPQMCWRDDIRAFSMNEVAINWNAPLVWVSAWLAEPPPTPLASRARQRIR